MEPKINSSTCCEAYEKPAVKMVWIQNGVLGKEEERLDLGGVSRGQGDVGVVQRPGNKADTEIVVVIVDLLALHS